MKFKSLIFMIYGCVMAGLTVVLFYACNKNNLFYQSDADFFLNQENIFKAEPKTNENPFHKEVGAPIDGTLGRQWIQNYKKSNTGRMDYFLTISSLKSILDNTDCVGICFYYAINGQNEQLILPVGIKKDGTALIPVKVETEQGAIAWKTAKQWMANYKGFIKARFFGSNTFDRLLEDNTCQVIRASFALNNQGAPQLLLANAAVSDPFVFENVSNSLSSDYFVFNQKN